MQRPVSIALVVLLGVAASLAIVFGGGSQPPPGDHRSATVTIVRGLVDPSSAPFFSDPRVRKEFAAHGLQVQVESRQSAEMARSTDLDAYDFAFSANLSVAKKIQRETGTGPSLSPFYSPLVIATTGEVAAALTKASLAERAGGYSVLHFQAYFDLVAHDTRWDELADLARQRRKPTDAGSDPAETPAHAAASQLRVTTGDPRTSNSAALYVALVSFMANDAQVVHTRAQLAAVRPVVTLLFRGSPPYALTTSGPHSHRPRTPRVTSDVPLGSELEVGSGRPMVAILESEFVGRYIQRRKSADRMTRTPSATATPSASPSPAVSADPIAGDTVLLYPWPTITAKHTLVPLTGRGDTVGKLLVNDARLHGLAADLGFRTANRAAFARVVEENGIPVPPDIGRVVDTPPYDMFDNLISAGTARS